MYEDRTLTCRDCGESFVFSSGEQAFFASKGLTNDPQRCPTCRAAAKRARNASPGGSREYHAAICNSCGGQAVVPFQPRNDRPVYCSTCFDKVRAGDDERADARLTRPLRRPCATGTGARTRSPSSRGERPDARHPALCWAGSEQQEEPVGVIIIREMVGTSPRSWSDAARQAVATASKTVRNIRTIEVVKSTARIEDGEIVEYQVELKIGFEYEG